MLIRISRALLWLAAVAALVALVGPDQDEGWLSLTAAMSLLAALAFWRAALVQCRSAVEEEPVPPTHLDETALMEIAVLCGRCCADADSATSLVDGVARLLKLELGSRWSSGRVAEPDAGFEPGGLGGRGSGIVIEVRLDGRQAAVIELSDLALAVAPNALNALIELVQIQVAEAIRRLRLTESPLAGESKAACSFGGGHPGGHAAPDIGAARGDASAPAVTSARVDGLASLSPQGWDVLVVGENQALAEVVGEMLRQQGCRFRQALSAEEGLRELCDQLFDLVLMDVDQPGLDVQAALGHFRRGACSRYPDHAGRRTPVVAIASRASVDDSANPIALGFDDQLCQPLCPSQFKAMLNRVLSPVLAAPADDHAGQGAAQHASAPAASVLDEQALQRLRELDPKGENNLLERVFKAFETSVARLLPQLHESLRTGDRAGVRHVAHTLKSSTASIGASRLSQQCAEIEAMIRLDDTSPLDSRVQAMCAEVEVVLQEVRRLMNAKG